MPLITPPPDLVIFDCDGVLIDSERIAVEVDLIVLKRAGLSMTKQEVVRRFLGRSTSVMEVKTARAGGQSGVRAAVC
jgi:beta-phosphoglucomutase-like phosphatase (HAD superfamily)